MDHLAEILNVSTVDWTSLSWQRSTLMHDHAMTWAISKVHVYTDSVLCLGKMAEHSEAIMK